MFLYNQNSRYYKSDTENDLPQQNLTRNNYKYNSTMVQANEAGRLDLRWDRFEVQILCAS